MQISISPNDEVAADWCKHYKLGILWSSKLSTDYLHLSFFLRKVSYLSNPYGSGCQVSMMLRKHIVRPNRSVAAGSRICGRIEARRSAHRRVSLYNRRRVNFASLSVGL